MADVDKDQKTEAPTSKKLEDARARGEVATAGEVRHAVMLTAMYVVMGGLGVGAARDLLTLSARFWGGADDIRIDPATGQQFAITLFGELAAALGPVFAVLFGAALLIGALQGRPTLAWARLKPRFSKLNPFASLARIFGTHGLIEFAKTLAKCVFVGGAALFGVWPYAAGVDQLVGMDPLEIARTGAALVIVMLKPVLLLVGALAAIDFVYQHRAFLKKMRMTLQEVKDEHKDTDGDPKVKARQRQVGRQRARQRMMAAVPEASVIVTNPTHFAVALKYEHGAMRAPIVVAKGVDTLALKIREVATEAKVPIVENRPLARALYASAEIDHPIPVEHYAAVAEIISYVMTLARQRAA